MIINIWILIARHCCKNFSNIVSFDLHNSPTRWVSIVCYFQMRKQSFAWGVGTSGWPSNLDNLSLELPLTTTSLCALGGNPQPGGARCRENVLYQGWLSVLLGTSDPWPERPGFKFGFPHLQTVVIGRSLLFCVLLSSYVRWEKSTYLTGSWVSVQTMVSSQHMGAVIKFTVEKQGWDGGTLPTAKARNPHQFSRLPLFRVPAFPAFCLECSSCCPFLCTWFPCGTHHLSLLWKGVLWLLLGLPVCGCVSPDSFPTWTPAYSASKAHPKSPEWYLVTHSQLFLKQRVWESFGKASWYAHSGVPCPEVYSQAWVSPRNLLPGHCPRWFWCMRSDLKHWPMKIQFRFLNVPSQLGLFLPLLPLSPDFMC